MRMKLSLQLGKFAFNLGRASAAEEQKSSSPFWQAWLRGREGEAGGGTTLVNAYTQSTWVYACVSTIARTVSGIPFRLLTGTEGDESTVQGGPAVELFKRPNELMNRFMFWFLVVAWQQLRGEAFLIALNSSDQVIDLSKPTRGAARIRKLCLLDPGKMREIVEMNTLLGWRYSTGTRDAVGSLDLLPGEVVHLPLPNPFDPWRGLSPLTVAMLPAQTDFNAAQFMKGVMGNNADTGLIVTTDQQPSAEQIEQIKASLRERRRQSGSVPPPLFLWGGSKIEKPTVSNVDLQFLENRKFSRQEVCAIFGVAQELMGFTEDANRSVSDAMRLSFMENRIAPYCAELEAGIEPVVRALDPGVRGEFHVKGTPIMQAAQRARWDTAVKAFGLGYSANECNEVLDLGMPSAPERDKKYLPFSLQEVGAGAEEEPAEEQGGKGEEETAADKALKLFERAADARAPVHVCAPDTRYAASIKGAIKLKQSKLRRFFFEQRARVLAKLESVTADASRLTSNQSLVTSAATRELEDDIFDLLDENRLLLSKVQPLIRNDFEFGVAQIGKDLGLDDFRVPPQDAIEFLNKRKNEIEGVNGKTFEELRSSLQEGLSNGDTFEDLKERVKAVYTQATEARAEVIALTETNIAVNSGRFLAMKEAKVEKKGWQTSNLAGVRASHLKAEQDYANGIPLNEPFRVGGFELMHPGDPSGPPGEVINCRCFTFAVLAEKNSSAPIRLLTFEEFTRRHQDAFGVTYPHQIPSRK